MKIAVSASGPGWDANVTPLSGHCQYFTIIDIETMEIIRTVTTDALGSNGDGISTAQAILEKGIQVVLTEYCRLITLQVLSHAGVTVITGASGKIRDVLREYLSGKLKANTKTRVTTVSGMKVRKMQGVDSVGKTEIEEPLNHETLEVMQHEWELVWPKVGE